MSVTERVQKDIVNAMKAKDKNRVAALRMILSSLQIAKKEAKDGFDEEKEMAVLRAEKKKRTQAAEGFRKGSRDDRAEKEEAESALIDSYLPQAPSEEELARIIEEAISNQAAVGIKDMGKVMSEVMSRTAGRADGKMVSEMVKARLSH